MQRRRGKSESPRRSAAGWHFASVGSTRHEGATRVRESLVSRRFESACQRVGRPPTHPRSHAATHPRTTGERKIMTLHRLLRLLLAHGSRARTNCSAHCEHSDHVDPLAQPLWIAFERMRRALLHVPLHKLVFIHFDRHFAPGRLDPLVFVAIVAAVVEIRRIESSRDAMVAHADNDTEVLALSLSMRPKLTLSSPPSSEAHRHSLSLRRRGGGVVGMREARTGAQVPKGLPRHGRNSQLRASEALFRWRESQRLQLVRRDSVQLKQPLMLPPTQRVRLGYSSTKPFAVDMAAAAAASPNQSQVIFFFGSFRAEAFFHSTAIRSQFNPPQPSSQISQARDEQRRAATSSDEQQQQQPARCHSEATHAAELHRPCWLAAQTNVAFGSPPRQSSLRLLFSFLSKPPSILPPSILPASSSPLAIARLLGCFAPLYAPPGLDRI